MKELQVKKHTFIEKDRKTVHVITFDVPVFGNNEEVLAHTLVRTLIDGRNYYLNSTSDLNTVRLSVFNESMDVID